MGMKVDRARIEGLAHLISETGFSGESRIMSMALSLGLFFDRRGDPGEGPCINVEASDLDIWPQIQIIVHDRDGRIPDVSGMNEYLQPFVLGGLDIMSGKVGGKKGYKALKALGELIPP